MQAGEFSRLFVDDIKNDKRANAKINTGVSIRDNLPTCKPIFDVEESFAVMKQRKILSEINDRREEAKRDLAYIRRLEQENAKQRKTISSATRLPLINTPSKDKAPSPVQNYQSSSPTSSSTPFPSIRPR